MMSKTFFWIIIIIVGATGVILTSMNPEIRGDSFVNRNKYQLFNGITVDCRMVDNGSTINLIDCSNGNEYLTQTNVTKIN